MKVIHITVGLMADGNLLSFEEGHFGAWGHRFARRLKFKYPDIEIECWTSYNIKHFGDRGISRINKDNIDYVLFPALGVSANLFFPHSMIKELRKLRKGNEKVIFHTQTLHTVPAYIISYVCSGMPLITQHRSPGHLPVIKYYTRVNPRLRIFYFTMQIIDNYCLKNYDHIFVTSFV